MRLKQKRNIIILLTLGAVVIMVVSLQVNQSFKEGSLLKKIKKAAKKVEKSAKSDIKSVTKAVETAEKAVVSAAESTENEIGSPVSSSGSSQPVEPQPTKFQKFTCSDYRVLETEFICDNVEMINNDGVGTVYYQDFSCKDYSFSGSGFSCDYPTMTDVLYGTNLPSSFQDFACNDFTITQTGFTCEDVVMNPES